jgi:hypothetical protein
LSLKPSEIGSSYEQIDVKVPPGLTDARGVTLPEVAVLPVVIASCRR